LNDTPNIIGCILHVNMMFMYITTYIFIYTISRVKEPYVHIRIESSRLLKGSIAGWALLRPIRRVERENPTVIVLLPQNISDSFDNRII